MYKPIENSWDWGESGIQVLNRSNFSKKASWYGHYERDPENTYAICIFLGAGETWGNNRNGDFFSELELLKSYKTFLDGRHYKHHDDNPLKVFGSIAAVYYNEKMHRVEGIIKIENKKNEEMIDRLSRGEQVPLSMGCNVDYDVCSICGNKAKTIKQYCRDLKERMCEIEPDGRIVCAKNINPKFYDISEVKRGADRTAWALRKIAGESESGTVHKLGMSEEKALHLLRRLASIEKRLDVGVIGVVDPLIPPALPKGEKPDLGSMSKAGAVFKFEDLGVKRAKERNVFTSLLTHPDLNSILRDMPYEGEYESSPRKVGELLKEHSLLSKHATYHNSTPTPLEECTNEDMTKLATLNLAIVCNNPSLLDDPTFPYLLVAQNTERI